MERLVDITLVKTSYMKDAIGQQVKTDGATRTLVCTLYSISRQEWQAAAQAGLNPECMAFLRDGADYEGEDIAEIDSVRYGVYRTYMTDDGGIELYLRKNVGVSL